MDDERKRILQMVANGIVSADEGAELLDALQPEPRREEPRLEMGRPHRQAGTLMIQVHEGDDARVNLRIPLALARAAGKFIPRRAQQHLNEYGIDLAAVLEDLTEGERGTLLEVQDSDDRVLISIE